MASSSTVTLNDVKLALDPGLMSETMLEAIRSGRYENTEAREITRIVQPGERIVELGAGIGYIAISALKTERVTKYVGFEANPKLIPLIERNAALNDVVVEVRNAVVTPGVGGGAVPFFLRKNFWASSLSPEPYSYLERIEVPTVSFIEILREERPTMLIVDIEGGEIELFKNIPLTGIKKIYIELHQKNIGRIGMKFIFDFMSSLDFSYDQNHSCGSVVLFSHVLR